MRLRIAGSMLACAALSAVAGADEVFLVGGGRIVGEVVEQRADAVVVEVGPGRVTLPASRVARVSSGTSALSVYRDRASRLGPRDADGWLALGEWARQNDLLTLATEAFERVLAIDPANEAAHRALGHVRLGSQWMSETESYRARGYVEYEGTWMTSEEAAMRAAQRMAETDARRADREAAAREREAEARARAAEAEAERAVAEARAAAESGGIPYPWVFGPGSGPYYYGGDVYLPSGRRGGFRHDRDGFRHHRRDVIVPPRRFPERTAPPPPRRKPARTTTAKVGSDRR